MRRPSLALISTWLLVATGTAAQAPDSPPQQLLSAPEPVQIAFVKSVLAQGMPAELAGNMVLLQRERSSIVLPIIEAKIEEVLKASHPNHCFTNTTVDPERFMQLAAAAIAYAGNDEALKNIE